MVFRLVDWRVWNNDDEEEDDEEDDDDDVFTAEKVDVVLNIEYARVLVWGTRLRIKVELRIMLCEIGEQEEWK